MDQFVVSARKYRPSTFETVVGQEHITITLQNAIRTNHLAQAFLFCGPRGVGKTTCARILAKTINCEHLSDDAEACDSCNSCTSFNQNASFNVHELDAASNNSVEDIRNLIDQVRYPPQVGKYKIYIIDEVHMLSTSAFNAFLKTLEEPPTYAIFILATTEKHKILPTILSRCQIFDFNRIQINDIAQHLAKIATREDIVAEPEALELIAQKADGGLRDALSMFDLNVTFAKDRQLRYANVLENLHILDYDYYFSITQQILAENLPQILLLFDEILKKGFDGHQFLTGLLEHFRNLMVCKDTITVGLLQVSSRVQEQYLRQSSQASLSFLLSALSVGSQADIHFKTAKNQRLHIELCLMKLAHLPAALNGKQLNTFPESESGEKKKLNEANTPSPPASTTVVSITPPRPSVSAGLGKLKTTSGLGIAPAQTATTVAESMVAMSNIFDLPQLQIIWNAFIAQQEAVGMMNEVVILNRPITLSGTTILLELDNDLQQALLNEFRIDLLTFLRTRLQNTQIQVQTSVVAPENKRMIYTQQEKFNFLVEKNPALLSLKNKLGLDLDY